MLFDVCLQSTVIQQKYKSNQRDTYCVLTLLQTVRSQIVRVIQLVFMIRGIERGLSFL